MFLKNLKLVNFRNFSKLDLDFSQTTLLIGNNAQGKSNLLESIYFLATTKSPRADKDIQLIKEEEEFGRVEGEVYISESMGQYISGSESAEKRIDRNTDTLKLEIIIQKKEGLQGIEKRVKVNGIPRRSTDYIGNLVVIHFSPEDINLVTGAPALRRWHLDLTLAQTDKEYKNALNEYHTALISRNRILKGIKEGIAKVDELDFWTQILIKNGAIISSKREVFFQFLNRLELGQSWGDFRFIYKESIISADRIREYLPREVAAAVSLIGPHRDDFIFKLNGKDLEYFGSRGEQRTAVLELKLAELKFIHEIKKTSPLLLLDDIFSELDEKHRDYIISVICQGQTIVSVVEEIQVPEKLLKEAKTVRVEKGRVIS